MKKNVLIFVKDPLVREDIVDIVSEVHPAPEITVVEDLEAARDSLGRAAGWAWAVIDLPRNAEMTAALSEAMRASDALPVVLSDPRSDPDMSD